MPEARIAVERDVYLNVLRILGAPDPMGPLHDILCSLLALSGAERGYLELYDDASAGQRRWAISEGCSEGQEAEIRAVTSRGIVAAAIASGSTLHTPVALLDERFSESRSVREQRLEAVLCVPLPGRHPGVLYLEGKRGSGAFSPETVSVVENVGAFLAAAAERALAGASTRAADPTEAIRKRLKLEGVAGRSDAMAHVFEQVALAAPLDVTVLITGPSGTGKTQLAQVLHHNSPRGQGPFVELNCAAIPEGLIESELFGTRPSAFPGARHAVGKVESAEGGTLFLDEISEIPFAAQGKLLQLLQSKQYYPLASARASVADVRLVVASNAKLEALVAERKFREDLFYRISVFCIRMPPLADRRDDIGCLVEALTAQIAAEHRMPLLGASPGFLAACEASDWPGNVRQLRHHVERALIRANAAGATHLERRHLFERPTDSEEAAPSFHEATRLFQRELVRRELEATGWNVSEVARRLELTRSHVYNLIKAFALAREQTGGADS